MVVGGHDETNLPRSSLRLRDKYVRPIRGRSAFWECLNPEP